MNIITAYTPEDINLIDYFFDLCQKNLNNHYMDGDILWMMDSSSTYIHIGPFNEMDDELDDHEKAKIKSLLNQDYVGTIIVWKDTHKLYKLFQNTSVEQMVVNNDYGSILKITNVKNMSLAKLKRWLHVK